MVNSRPVIKSKTMPSQAINELGEVATDLPKFGTAILSAEVIDRNGWMTAPINEATNQNWMVRIYGLSGNATGNATIRLYYIEVS